jgi:hypothetical protein
MISEAGGAVLASPHVPEPAENRPGMVFGSIIKSNPFLVDIE